MHVASARRIRPRRWASSTAGSSVGSTRFRIARDCNGHRRARERTHRAGRKLPGARGVVPEVTTNAPTRPSARAYAVWGVAVLAYAVGVFNGPPPGVPPWQGRERFSAGRSPVSWFWACHWPASPGRRLPGGLGPDPFGAP